MNSFKDKLQIFIIGLMVGLIISGGFFILKLDDYFKELNFYKNVAKALSVDRNSQSSTKVYEVLPIKEIKSNGNNAKNKKNQINDASLKTNFVLDADTLTNHLTKDSLVAEKSLPDDIIIRKDELLFTKTLEVINLGADVGRSGSKDSLLQKISGIKDDKNTFKQFINIEFWSSPLNYKGYKMSKYKIILYGLSSEGELKIFKFDDEIYLKSNSQIFKLEYVSDFKPYEHITDETIINKLK